VREPARAGLDRDPMQSPSRRRTLERDTPSFDIGFLGGCTGGDGGCAIG
jgi:hypothetical protein